jgi:hypothetical protein
MVESLSWHLRWLFYIQENIKNTGKAGDRTKDQVALVASPFFVIPLTLSRRIGDGNNISLLHRNFQLDISCHSLLYGLAFRPGAYFLKGVI